MLKPIKKLKDDILKLSAFKDVTFTNTDFYEPFRDGSLEAYFDNVIKKYKKQGVSIFYSDLSARVQQNKGETSLIIDVRLAHQIKTDFQKDYSYLISIPGQITFISYASNVDTYIGLANGTAKLSLDVVDVKNPSMSILGNSVDFTVQCKAYFNNNDYLQSIIKNIADIDVKQFCQRILGLADWNSGLMTKTTAEEFYAETIDACMETFFLRFGGMMLRAVDLAMFGAICEKCLANNYRVLFPGIKAKPTFTVSVDGKQLKNLQFTIEAVGEGSKSVLVCSFKDIKKILNANYNYDADSVKALASNSCARMSQTSFADLNVQIVSKLGKVDLYKAFAFPENTYDLWYDLDPFIINIPFDTNVGGYYFIEPIELVNAYFSNVKHLFRKHCDNLITGKWKNEYIVHFLVQAIEDCASGDIKTFVNTINNSTEEAIAERGKKRGTRAREGLTGKKKIGLF